MSECVILDGGERPFGTEIVEALARDGLDPCAPGKAAALVINRPVELRPVRFEDLDDLTFDSAVEDAVFSVFDGVRAQAPHLADGAAIVVVASRAHLGAWGAAHHAAAGSALVAFCRTLALELAPAGFRVNVVIAEFAETYADDRDRRRRVAEAAAWLASRRSAGVNGAASWWTKGAASQFGKSRRNLGPNFSSAFP